MVQLHADSAVPFTASGADWCGWPGRYCATVAPGTAVHASGTWRSSPGWNVVMSPSGVTEAGPDPPVVSRITATTAPAITTRAPPSMNQCRRRRAA